MRSSRRQAGPMASSSTRAATPITAWPFWKRCQVCGVPAVEVMLADPSGKEPFRSVDVVSFGCQGRFAGEGVSGYLHACAYLVQLLRLDGGAQTHLVQ